VCAFLQGALHDLLLDPETPKCLQRMVDWVNAHV
jgi:hypothetical protein